MSKIQIEFFSTHLYNKRRRMMVIIRRGKDGEKR
jgi:hypothetical protein